jgi:hypothetical protein
VLADTMSRDEPCDCSERREYEPNTEGERFSTPDTKLSGCRGKMTPLDVDATSSSASELWHVGHSDLSWLSRWRRPADLRLAAGRASSLADRTKRWAAANSSSSLEGAADGQTRILC